MTDRRVIFMVNRVDGSLGGESWSRALTEVSRVAVEKRHLGIPLVTKDVGLRRRLRLELNDRSVEIFLVNRATHAVRTLRAAISDLR